MKTAKKPGREIQKLLDGAAAAFREGRFSDTEALIGKALNLEPRLAGAHDLLARVCLRGDRFAEAERHGRQAVTLNGGETAFRDTLAIATLRAGNADALIVDFEKAVAVLPDDFGTAYGYGVLLMEMGRNEEALEHLEHALGLMPESFALVLKIAALYGQAGRYEEALALANGLISAGNDSAELHALAGRCLLVLQKPRKALESFKKALARNDRAYKYYTGLSAAHWQSGQLQQARKVTSDFLAKYPSMRRTAKNSEACVLVLGALRDGCFTKWLAGDAIYAHANTIAQIDPRRLTFHHAYIDHPDPVAAIRAAGAIDVVFNNVANAEAIERRGLTNKVQSIVDGLGVPVANAPAAIARTTRRENAERISAELDIVCPRTRRYTLTREGLDETAADITERYSFPVIIRATESHRDESVPRIDDESGLPKALESFVRHGIGGVYVIEFRGEAYRPGIYRRFRCALIDGVVYPSLGDFSPDWNVHRLDTANAFMKANPALMEEERAFLDDPAGHIGAENIARLEALAGFLELEFLGVDFNVTAKGELVLFEANAVMRMLFPHLFDDFPYLAEAHGKISVAFEDMLLRKARG